MVRLLAEVVETCGLPPLDPCCVIRDNMKSFRPSAGAAKAMNADEVFFAQGLSAVAQACFLRALCRRPFCAKLAIVE